MIMLRHFPNRIRYPIVAALDTRLSPPYWKRRFYQTDKLPQLSLDGLGSVRIRMGLCMYISDMIWSTPAIVTNVHPHSASLLASLSSTCLVRGEGLPSSQCPPPPGTRNGTCLTHNHFVGWPIQQLCHHRHAFISFAAAVFGGVL